MKLPGFIGPSYTLDSVNVDCQRTVNLYPEVIESGNGKEGRVKYFKSTPGLELIKEVGSGPIRCIHQDAVGRNFVVSGNELYLLTHVDDWTLSFIPNAYDPLTGINQASAVNASTDQITYAGHGLYTGQKVWVSSTVSGSTTEGTLPAGLTKETDYFVIVVDANTIALASSLANALSGTKVNITSAGTDVLKVASLQPMLLDVPFSAFDASTETFTSTAHGLFTGLEIQITSTGDVSGDLQLSTTYYIIKVDADNFKLASSVSNASSGTNLSFTPIDSSAETWNAVLCGSKGQDGGSALTFSASSGPVKAKSMKGAASDVDYLYNPTLFVDGSTVLYIGDITLTQDLINGGLNLGARIAAAQAPEILPTHIEWSDSYFIVNEPGSDRFWVSDLAGVTIDALSFTTSEGSPDDIVGLIVSERVLYALNETTTEVYANTGNADFPFERVQGGFLEVGCMAGGSISAISGAVFFLGRTKEGEGQVYMAQGMSAKRISTHAVEQAISGYSDISSATAFTYQFEGHSFYVLNFDEATWVYDLSTGLWHERAYTNAGTLERHRAENHQYIKAQRLHLVGDYESNKVYALKDGVYTDNSDAITRLRRFPHASAGLKTVFCHALQVDMETGVGLASGQGSDPQVMLRWSNDGGHTWSDESWTSAGGQVGGIGEYTKRVRWRRLGRFRDRVFEIKITDPVSVTLIGAHIELEVGVS